MSQTIDISTLTDAQQLILERSEDQPVLEGRTVTVRHDDGTTEEVFLTGAERALQIIQSPRRVKASKAGKYALKCMFEPNYVVDGDYYIVNTNGISFDQMPYVNELLELAFMFQDAEDEETAGKIARLAINVGLSFNVYLNGKSPDSVFVPSQGSYFDAQLTFITGQSGANKGKRMLRIDSISEQPTIDGDSVTLEDKFASRLASKGISKSVPTDVPTDEPQDDTPDDDANDEPTAEQGDGTSDAPEVD